jgi:hypothetical protein
MIYFYQLLRLTMKILFNIIIRSFLFITIVNPYGGSTYFALAKEKKNKKKISFLYSVFSQENKNAFLIELGGVKQSMLGFLLHSKKTDGQYNSLEHIAQNKLLDIDKVELILSPPFAIVWNIVPGVLSVHCYSFVMKNNCSYKNWDTDLGLKFDIALQNPKELPLGLNLAILVRLAHCNIGSMFSSGSFHNAITINEYRPEFYVGINLFGEG